ncbi:MAG TPA: PAS domain-containing protein [Gemmatimonadaceae bacterium]|jgi:PAS domain S-box-containing protein
MEDTTPAHLAAILADAAARDAGDASVIATSYDGTVVYWNERAEALFGWRTDEALGRNILDVTPTRNSLDEATRIMERLSRGDSFTGPFIVQRRDGTPIVIDVANHPVTVGGRVVGIIGVSRRRRQSGEARAIVE